MAMTMRITYDRTACVHFLRLPAVLRCPCRAEIDPWTMDALGRLHHPCLQRSHIHSQVLCHLAMGPPDTTIAGNGRRRTLHVFTSKLMWFRRSYSWRWRSFLSLMGFLYLACGTREPVFSNKPSVPGCFNIRFASVGGSRNAPAALPLGEPFTRHTCIRRP